MGTDIVGCGLDRKRGQVVLVLEKPLRPLLVLVSALEEAGWIMGGMSHGLYDS
jgi:hypothetical protein